MTPYQERKMREEHKKFAEEMSSSWHFPLSGHRKKLFKVLDEMAPFKLNQEDVPLIIKLTENPNYFTSKLFGGAVDLFTHDCIHVILGRGLLVKDEAFVIGYTMGSTKMMKRWKRNLFMFFSKYLYPKGYTFGEEERFVFNMGVMAGAQCGVDLSKTDFSDFHTITTHRIRIRLGIDKELLKTCYKIEESFFPDSQESQRLLL